MTKLELTKRQKEVTDLVCLGLSNQEVANLLGLTRNGIEVHLEKVFSKLNIHHRTQLLLCEKPDSFKKIVIKDPIIEAIKNREHEDIKPVIFKNAYEKEIYNLKVQRLKAALIASCMVDYVSNEYIKNELNKLLTILRPQEIIEGIE